MISVKGGKATYQPTARFIGIKLNGVVEDLNVVGNSPFLGVLELLEGILDVPSTGAEVSAIPLSA